MFEKNVHRPIKILQFGEGGFLRAFADWMIQKVNDSGAFEGGVAIVQPIAQGLCDRLMAQGGVYNLLQRGLRDGVPTVDATRIDVIESCVNPYRDYEAYLALAELPELRFVISNTTEAGIVYEAGDKLTDAPQKSFPAKVTAFLYRRFQKNLPGLVFLPCELIEKNGTTLREIVLRYASEWALGDAFSLWVEKENIFCNTLVDRIVTGYPKDEDLPDYAEDGMLDTSELFHLWVIEGYMGLFEELPLDRAGLNVILTEDITPYRTRKVRILNGAHTSMIPYALLSGVATVRECMLDETLSSFVRGCVYEEIIPTLDLPREELESYAEAVFERFENPYIKHYCASISLNSVSKFRVRVLPSLLEYRRRFGKEPERLLCAFAKLIDFYRTDAVKDDPEVAAFMKSASVEEILANEKLWGEDLSALAAGVKKYANS